MRFSTETSNGRSAPNRLHCLVFEKNWTCYGSSQYFCYYGCLLLTSAEFIWIQIEVIVTFLAFCISQTLLAVWDVAIRFFWNKYSQTVRHLYEHTPSWWRHQMETFPALLVICAGNSPVTGEFPSQRPVTRGFDVFFDLRLNKRLSKQSWGWWFETPSRILWRHSNGCLPLYTTGK